MPTTDSQDKAKLNWGALWKLLPRRIPGRVQKTQGGESTGNIRPLISANYPNGRPLDLVFSLQLGSFKSGDEVLFEWSLAHEAKRRSQPDRIEATRVVLATKSEITAAVTAYRHTIALHDLEQRKAKLDLDVQQHEGQVKSLPDLQAALSRDQEDLAQKKRKLDEREQGLNAQQAELTELRRSEESFAQEKRKLEERERGLVVQMAGLSKRQDQIDQEIAIAVVTQVAEQKLKLVQKEEELKQGDARLQAREDDLRQREKQLIADRQTIAAARAQFESEGGKAYIEYVNSITSHDSVLVSRLQSKSSPALDPLVLAKSLGERGYVIDASDLRRAVVGLLAAWSMGQFLVLAGPTGVGKTQLVRRLANDVLGAGHGPVPVRPGWVEPADLLGFYNPMHKLFEPTPFLDCLQHAIEYEKQNRLYALCLDEMNLSRVESYAADILSRVERASAGESASLDLYSADVAWRMRREEEELVRMNDDLPPEKKAYRDTLTRQLHRFPPSLSVPRSLILLGTVNVDDTTHAFSPKFLDRAFVLRFPPAQLPPMKLNGATTRDSDAMVRKPNSELWPLSLEFATQLLEQQSLPESFEAPWMDFRGWQQEFLTPLGIYFGYRFAAGFRRYLSIGYKLGMQDGKTLADDFFQAKIAPRIRFGVDERAVGASGKTKYQYVEEWLKHKTLQGGYRGLAGVLRTMYDRAQGTEMVELWD